METGWPVGLTVAVYAAILGIYLQPHILGDDAAVTFRYVDRLLAKQGFSYNSHERVFGIGNPLYALILALFGLVGVDLETAARGTAVVLFVASAVLAAHLTTLLSGSKTAGIIAGLVLATDSYYRQRALSGMESGLSVTLGLLVILAVLKNREAAAAIFLGLAVWNKLDAGLLALALTVACLVVTLQFPGRLALISGAVVVPWMIFALLYYDSFIPLPLTAKLMGKAAVIKDFDYLWVWKFLIADYRFIFLLGTVAALDLLHRRIWNEGLAIVTLFVWFLLHGVAVSVINMGGYYPWYLTVLIPPMVILTCSVSGDLLRRDWSWPYKWAAGAGVLILLALSAKTAVHVTYTDLAAGNAVKPAEAYEGDWRLAGIFLNTYAEPGAIVAAAYGWTAFESRRPFNDLSLLNGIVMKPSVMYRVEYVDETERLRGASLGGNTRGPARPPGFMPLANFNLASDLFMWRGWVTVFGRPDSGIARMGARYLQYRLAELAPPEPYSAQAGLQNIKIEGLDLLAHPPSGATFTVENAYQPLRVVFTPGFNSSVPADKTDGVTFEVWHRNSRLYQWHIVPRDRVQPAVLEIPGAQNAATIAVSLITTPGPKGDTNYDWAIWKSVKFVVGDAVVDMWRLRDRKMGEAWAGHNPTGTGSRVDQLARTSTRPKIESAAGYGGVVDSVHCGAIGGWFWTSVAPDVAMPLEVHIDDTLQAKIKADQLRPDLKQAGLGTGRYGFAYTIPARWKDGQAHAFSVKVEQSGYQLDFYRATPRSFTCSP